MTGKKEKKTGGEGHGWYRFIFAERSRELTEIPQKVLFVIWNMAALLLSSAVLCVVCLSFAIGRHNELFYIFLGYLRTPEIFILNWIPLLLLQLVLYCTVNRQWLSFLLASAVALPMSVGNYFKLIYRSDPFRFNDLTSIRAGLSVAGDYDISVDWRILLAILFVAAAVLILFFFAHARVSVLPRLIAFILVAASILPLWRFVYSDYERYTENAYKNFLFITRDTRDFFVANGFFYPFLYSITESSNIPPDGYDEEKIEEILSNYQNTEIPEERKVSLMVLQLESFCDLEAMGMEGISEKVYEGLRQLERESIHGTMIASVIGGGTVTTERCVLTGSFDQQDYFRPSWSYVRYLDARGFRSVATHPNVGYFYSRESINSYLGFENFYDLENYFQDMTGGEWRCDEAYLPEVFRMFREDVESGQPAFHFNVSLQGHFPYNESSFDRESDLWQGEKVSDSTRFMLNNYLSLIMETQQLLLKELEGIRAAEEPMVVMIYGDHKPWFGDEVYEELGITVSMETEKDMEDYLGTPYLIWANDAAKNRLKGSFSGEGPLTSPGYLMNLLFNSLGWEGPAFMQYTESVREHLPVICTRGGYIEDGTYTQRLSEEGRALREEYRNVLYYLRYRPELAA